MDFFAPSITNYLFPLHRCRGFAGDVVHDPVDVLDLIGNAVGDGGKDVVGNSGPVGGHEIVGGDGADGQEVVVGSVVAHDAHSADAGEDAEELGHLALIAVLGHFIPENPVGLLEDLHLLGGDFTDDAHAQTGTGEGLPPDQLMGNAQLLAYPADLILKEARQRLNDVQELYVVGHFDLVVVGLDLIGVALAGLDAVGIDGTLGKESILTALAADLVPEYLIELGADDLPLLLRVGNALEAGQEVLLAIDPDEMHVKEAGEGLLYEVALVLAHEALVHKDAGQLVTHSPADQARSHGGIHAAGQAENDLLIADALPQSLDGILNERIHLPVAGAEADIVQEVFEHLIAELAVGHLGMELDSVELLRLVLHGSHRAVIGGGGDLEALRQLIDPVRMTHPHDAAFGHIGKELGSLLFQVQLDLAVFGSLSGDDRAAGHPCGELATVANAENGNAQLQNLWVIVGGGHIIDAVGAAGEDDALVVPGLDLGGGNGIVLLDLRIDMEIPDSAGDQLVILSAEVQHKNFFQSGYLRIVL